MLSAPAPPPPPSLPDYLPKNAFRQPALSPEMLHERRLASQLMHLASQFHGSEYNQAKFGPRGSPVTYIPLSIHIPDHYRQLQARQAVCAEAKAWWLYDRRAFLAARRTDAQSSHLHSPLAVTVSTSCADLSCDLSAAIDTPLVPAPLVTAEPRLKTSDTHPINISPIVPPELLPTISLHLSPSQPNGPTMFNIHHAFSLDRLTTLPFASSPPPPPLPTPVPTTPAPPLPAEFFAPSPDFPPPVSQFTWNRSSMQRALQAALTSDIHPRSPAAFTKEPSTPSVPRLPPLNLPKYDILGEILASADDNMLFEPSVASHLGHARNLSAPPIMFQTLISDALSPNRRALNTVVAGGLPAIRKDSFQRRHAAWNLTAISENPPSKPEFSQLSSISERPPHDAAPGIPLPPTPAPSVPTIGNLFLSSCPGKKVRLNGPVRGRGAICRDLKQDLERMKDAGVGCIVCCLDDDELEFLGAPWPVYSQVANELGLDILRIPMPEGLAPVSARTLDAQLARLISTYTLNGAHVLVHCRGGVGRAGLIACCWMLRLGLCGTPLPARRAGAGAGAGHGAGEVRAGTLQLVERVVAIVRRRRSLKAIETYEQVKFLVGYVEFMAERAAEGGA